MDAPPVQYVTTGDGYNIAYAVRGEGRPLVWMPHMWSHIEIYWKQDTFVLPWLQALANQFRLIQYDGRGQGMSSRGLTPDHSLFDNVRDLEAVTQRLHLNHFIVSALGWSSHAAVRFAIDNPEHVDALVLQGSPVVGSAWPTSVFLELASTDWDAFIRNIAAQGIPNTIFASVQRLRQSANQDDYLALARAFAESDISELLPQVRVPTLVIHPRDFIAMSTEDAMKVAGSIPDARLALIDGATAPGDAVQALAAIEAFLAELPSSSHRQDEPVEQASIPLSLREIDVLRLVVAGRSNQEIADELVISLNTVRRHVSNIFDKTGAANRTQAAAYARDHGIA